MGNKATKAIWEVNIKFNRVECRAPRLFITTTIVVIAFAENHLAIFSITVHSPFSVTIGGNSLFTTLATPGNKATSIHGELVKEKLANLGSTLYAFSLLTWTSSPKPWHPLHFSNSSIFLLLCPLFLSPLYQNGSKGAIYWFPWLLIVGLPLPPIKQLKVPNFNE